MLYLIETHGPITTNTYFYGDDETRHAFLIDPGFTPERILAAARCAGVRLAIPRPGESIDPLTTPPPTRWWPKLAWRTAIQKPQVATLDGNPARRVPVPACKAAS